MSGWCQNRFDEVQVGRDAQRFTCKQLYFRSGAEGIRTPDLRRAKAALSRLSYGPIRSRGILTCTALSNISGGLQGFCKKVSLLESVVSYTRYAEAYVVLSVRNGFFGRGGESWMIWIGYPPQEGVRV